MQDTFQMALETDVYFHRAPLGNLEGGSSTQAFERWLKGALEVGRFSLWELCEGNLEGGLPCWELWRMGKALELGISFHRGPAVELGRGLIYRRL